MSLSPQRATQTWSGAWLHVLRWLSQVGGHTGANVASYLTSLQQRIGEARVQNVPPANITQLSLDVVMEAWDAALQERWNAAAATPHSAVADYVSSAAMRPADCWDEDGYPSDMPLYVRHTSRFHNREHVRSLMRLRCGSLPLAACDVYTADAPFCTHCEPADTASPCCETVEHFLLQCPAYAGLRSQPRFTELFAGVGDGTLPDFMNQRKQYRLAEFVHLCWQHRTGAVSAPPLSPNEVSSGGSQPT